MTQHFTDLFIEHPATVGETYSQHFCSACRFALAMSVGVIVCLVHAVFPFLFEKTGSRIITRLYQRMVTHRHRDSGAGANEPLEPSH